MSKDTVPGMNYPTQKAMLAGNPRDSAIQAQINSDNRLNSMGKIGGKKNKMRKLGGSSQIPVPQYQMMYTPQGGVGTNPNAQIQQNSQISTQGAANAVYDKQALRGGSNTVKWGCYSGGKRSRRNKKSRKTRKLKRSRKSRKSRK
jgi:hypothetical protein